MLDRERVRELIREADFCASEPPEYAEEILVDRIDITWHVICRHGTRLNRYVVREEVQITPVDEHWRNCHGLVVT